ncbi:MAG: class I tRNA ligase family protein, partial [Mycetocola sp.]
SMPFAQVHYPFENREWFDSHNPADFIVEYIGQTRGWFYTLHVLSTALFDRPAFKNVVSHGIVLGSDGQKMSKSLRNYPDVNEVFDRDGSDAMRWFLMSSSVLRGGNLVVTEEGIREGVRQMLLPLWNTWYFFSLYANTAKEGGYDAKRRTDSPDVLDRYILAKSRVMLTEVTAHLDNLDSTMAAATLRDFAYVLTNWYVRRSRDRFWTGVAEDGSGSDAFDTLYTVLETLTRAAAPLLPLVSERIWKDLTGGRSIHLTDWPDAAELPEDDVLVRAMDSIRVISSTVLSLRKQAGRRVRLPLASLTVVAPDPSVLAPFEDILRDELNVKEVRFVQFAESSAVDYGITSRLTVNARAAGPRLGKNVQTVIKAARAGDWSETDGVVTAGGIPLEPGEYDLVLETASTDGTSDSALALLAGGGFVLLDTATTPALEAEGLARDVVRSIQDTRKAAGFDVSDRIVLGLVFADPGDADAISFVTDVDIAAETLATTSSIHVLDEVPEASRAGTPAEWLPALFDGPVEFYQEYEQGAFANAGSFTVAVRRVTRSIDV